jgi:hypothetical protein
VVTELEPQLLQQWWEYAGSQGVRLEAKKSHKQPPKPTPAEAAPPADLPQG